MAKKYKIKDIFYTLEGEGANVNKPIIIIETAGCNLDCLFCDVDKAAREELTATEIANRVARLSNRFLSSYKCEPFILLTGGEALLEVDGALINDLRMLGKVMPHDFTIGLETNGTLPLNEIKVDYLIVRPKPGAGLWLRQGDELKLVYPIGLDPADFIYMDFKRFFLTPWIPPSLDDLTIQDMRADNIMACIEYCLEHPQWNFSIQSHKIYGIK